MRRVGRCLPRAGDDPVIGSLVSLPELGTPSRSPRAKMVLS